MSDRVPLVCGNWKMHKTVEEAVALVDGLVQRAEGFQGVEVAVAPPFTALHAVAKRLGGKIRLGAQNVHQETQGAFTGEVSSEMLADVGVGYVIVGHSERRAMFAETDAVVRDKLRAVLHGGMRPILCVGETLAQRDADQTLEVVAGQVEAALQGCTPSELALAVVAYEPVWAIGTGRTASPDDAQRVHAHIRRCLGGLHSDVAGRVRILYGGSMKPDNAAGLLAQPDIDGGLIGGASLQVEAFSGIIAAARASTR